MCLADTLTWLCTSHYMSSWHVDMAVCITWCVLLTCWHGYVHPMMCLTDMLTWLFASHAMMRPANTLKWQCASHAMICLVDHSAFKRGHSWVWPHCPVAAVCSLFTVLLEQCVAISLSCCNSALPSHCSVHLTVILQQCAAWHMIIIRSFFGRFYWPIN